MNHVIHIDESLCTGCNSCAGVCHRDLSAYNRNGKDTGALECILCYHCYAVCPQAAISIEGVEDTEHGERETESERLSVLLSQRRSCRSFQDRQVDENILAELVRSAASVPSGGNAHLQRLTLITDGSARNALEQALASIYKQRRKILASAMIRTVCSALADSQTRAFLRDSSYLKRVTYLLEQIGRGRDPIFYNAPAILVVHSEKLIPTPKEDCILAAYNVVLMAETMGLGSCFVSLAQNAINNSKACKKILGLKRKENVHAVVVLGYPAVRFSRPIPRMPIPATRLGDSIDRRA